MNSLISGDRNALMVSIRLTGYGAEYIMNINPDYHNEKLTYTDDNLLLDSNGSAIMMGWEKNIMKYSAFEICKNGGDILNIGFGLGFIDTYIYIQNIIWW